MAFNIGLKGWLNIKRKLWGGMSRKKEDVLVEMSIINKGIELGKQRNVN